MDYKTIRIKKSQSTLFSLIISMLIIIGIFIGLFLWVNFQADKQGVTVDSQYNTTYQGYENATTGMSDTIDEISTRAKAIKEADSTWQVAWNSLIGLGSVLKLPLNFIDTGTSLYEASTTQVSGIVPPWTVLLIRIGIIGLIVLIVVSVLKGDTNLIK